MKLRVAATGTEVSASEKKPRPYVREVSAEETDWAPVAIPQWLVVNGERVRSGTSFAICREGYERWPLGHSKDRYKIEGHNEGFDAVLSFTDAVEAGQSFSTAHGYQVAREYNFKAFFVEYVETARGRVRVSTRLVLTHDHTASGSATAALTLFVDGNAVGAILYRSMKHVGVQSMRFRQEIAGLAESAIIAQSATLDLFRKAAERPFTEVERRWLARREVRVKGKPATLLEALQGYLKGYMKKGITWNTWERRLNDDAICLVVSLLGPATVGRDLDDALGKMSHGYAGLPDASEECAEIAAKIDAEEEEKARKAS